MATEQLKQAYEAAQKLSLKDQDMLAKKILEEIEEMEWDEIMSRPKVQEYLDKLEEKLEDDIATGCVKEWNPGEDLEALFQP